MAFPNLPRLTAQVEVERFQPAANALYIHGSNSESRSSHIDQWRPRASDIEFVQLSPMDSNSVVARHNDVESTVQLRSIRALEDFVSNGRGRSVYLDITGLPHHVWAPIVRVLIERVDVANLHAVYAEPAYYTRAPDVHAGLFELSERLNGIAPLPGFVTLATTEDSSLIVPMLGFEGNRLRHLVSELEAPDDRIIPIVGVPGFQHTYPMYSFLGNRHVLKENFRFQQVEYARANCMFDAAIRLLRIAETHPDSKLQIAPIGTKPHALAAVLFALAKPDIAELVYDHPIRRPGRTAGTGLLCLYPLTGFVDTLSMS